MLFPKENNLKDANALSRIARGFYVMEIPKIELCAASPPHRSAACILILKERI